MYRTRLGKNLPYENIDAFKSFWSNKTLWFETYYKANEKFKFFFNKFGVYDSITIDNVSYIWPVLNSGKDWLDGIFDNFPEHTTRMSELWDKMYEKYKRHESPEWKASMKKTTEYMKQLEILVTKGSLSYYDKDFIVDFFFQNQNRLEPFSEKQLAMIEKWLRKYRKQLRRYVSEQL